jgi:hypothetical protein
MSAARATASVRLPHHRGVRGMRMMMMMMMMMVIVMSIVARDQQAKPSRKPDGPPESYKPSTNSGLRHLKASLGEPNDWVLHTIYLQAWRTRIFLDQAQ